MPNRHGRQLRPPITSLRPAALKRGASATTALFLWNSPLCPQLRRIAIKPCEVSPGSVMALQSKRPFGSIVLVTTLLMSWVVVTVLATTARAGDCLAAPNSPAPPGSHWYYRLDWVTQRKCWYVRTLNQSDQQAAAQATKGQASLLHWVKPKPAAGGAPLSVSPGDTDSPSSPVEVIAVKPNDASVSGASTDVTTSSIPAASAPRQDDTSSEANAQVAESASNAAHSSDRDQSFQAMVITVSMGS